MELRTVGSYARELRPHLPAETFEPARSRVLWLPAHVLVIALCAWSIASGHAPMWVWPAFSLVIGFCLAGITFLGHETLHGGVVRGRFAIRLVGWLGFLPFTVSPQLWMAWHNRVHHNHCGQEGVDPDMYPTLHEYRTERFARWMAHLGIGRRKLVGYASLLFGFTGQSTQMLLGARKKGLVSARLHRRVWIETVLGWMFWATVAVIVGLVPFVFIYLLPLVVANTIVMLFIMTNHNLSPLTNVNDPLVNSLSVTLPRPLEWLTLDFGYHTEHHLFPTASTRHGRTIRAAILERYPERYQSLPLGTALARLHNTARVYQDAVTLIDPQTGETWPTLQPRAKAIAPALPVVPNTPFLDEAAKKLDEATAAAGKKLDAAAAATSKAFDEATAAASRAIDDAKAAAHKALDDAAKALHDKVDEVLEPAAKPSRV